jgi:hypothetical protein
VDSNKKHQKKTLQNIEICHHFRIDFASPPTEKETKGEKYKKKKKKPTSGTDKSGANGDAQGL